MAAASDQGVNPSPARHHEVIYVLKLEEGKFYVGKTANVERRFAEHLGGVDGSAWTRKYHPLEIVEIVSETNDFIEDAVTKQYMKRHGIENVRGGCYSNVTLSDVQLASLLVEMRHSEGACVKCGSKDHWVNECDGSGAEQPAPQKSTPPPPPLTDPHAEDVHGLISAVSKMTVSRGNANGCCFRCGRKGHWIKKCYAKTTVDGRPLSVVKEDTASGVKAGVIFEEDDADDDTGKICTRCGRIGHSIVKCYAKTTITGKRL